MKRMTPPEVDQQVEALRSMDAKALRSRWREVLKTEPPPKMQSGFLRLAIAYRLQELAYGGLKPNALRQLRKYSTAIDAVQPTICSDGTTTSRLPFTAQISLSPGTRLMREWNGTTQLVEVVESGFVWRGVLYKTLSATAVAITGTKWSGPKFFGLLPAQVANAKRTPKPDNQTIVPAKGRAA